MTTWRRYHGERIVAHVGSDEMSERYRVAVGCEGEEESVIQAKRQFNGLDFAKAASDALARETFNHRCTTAMCGQWMIWTA
jgi:hypothetical protein